MIRYPLFSLIICLLYSCNTEKERFVPGKLRNTVVGSLQETLNSDLKWEKVHAAEFLVNLGYTENVYDTFLEEEKQKGSEHYYRIGIWRVLAKAASNPEEKQQWLDSIVLVFKKPMIQVHLKLVQWDHSKKTKLYKLQLR